MTDDNNTFDPVLLHSCHLLQGETQRIDHEDDLGCVQIIALVELERDDKKCK